MSIPTVKAKIVDTEQAIKAMELDKTKRIWDNFVLIGEVRKSNKIKFVFGAGIRDGVRYLNIREFYLRKRDGRWMPGRDGLTIPLMVPIEEGTKIIKPYDDFIKMMAETKEALEIMDLYDEDNVVYVVPKEKNDA